MPQSLYESAVDALSTPDPNRILYGYYKDEALIGCCGSYWDGEKCWVSWTAVDPQYQHQKIGTTLLGCVIADTNTTLYVETYEHPAFFNAVQFYWKNGFRLCGQLYRHGPDGSTVLYLERVRCVERS